MPVYPTGLGNEAIVPCSHCNPNDQGPEAGICHRNTFGNRSTASAACAKCLKATEGFPDGFIGGALGAAMSAIKGDATRTPCSYCSGRGYVKV